MPHLKRVFLISILFFSLPALKAQVFGGNPPSLHWRQVNTDTVRVIFPKGLESMASQIARISGQLGTTQSTLGSRFRKISIVLQNQTTYSNAYVGLGPRRSEFYLTALQNSFELGSLPWQEQLVLHEFRHVQQFNNFNKGISRAFYFLAGEYGLAFINSAAIPNWFWEGDAVFQETQQSRQGRGRLPFFFNPYRSLYASGKKYSWLKLRNGSYRDYIPNHYHLGYMLAAYGREKYGDDIWAKVTDDAVRFKGLFYPFQKAIRKYTGKGYSQFRQEAIQFFSEQVDTASDHTGKEAAAFRHFAGDQEHPQWIDNDHLLYVSSGFKEIPAFVLREIHNGKETKIRVKDISLDNYFSARHNQVVYAARGFDPRWGWRDYSEIRLLDLQTGQQRSLTRRSRLFSPDISEDGHEIIAVEMDTQGGSSLILLSGDSGAILKKFSNAEGLVYTYPKFFKQHSVVTAVRNAKGEMSIGILSLETGSIEWKLPFSMNVIGLLQVMGDTISFTATEGTRDRLFILVDNRLFRYQKAESNAATGSYQLVLRNDQAAWTDFTSAGYRLSLSPFAARDFEAVPDLSLAGSLPDYRISVLNKLSSSRDTTSSKTPIPSRKYSQAFRLINIHSWLPSISDPEYTLSFLSDNVLNTLSAQTYFTYNTNERSKKVGAVAAFGGWYPWIRFGGAYTADRSGTYQGNKVVWNEAELRGGLLIPWNFSGGKYYRNLSVGTDYVWNKPDYKGAYKDTFDNRPYGYVFSFLSFTNQSQKALQHIYPRWAQTLRLEYSYGVTQIEGTQWLANGYLYFPGLHVNHNFVVNLAWQQRDTLRQILYTNNFPFARGYNERSFHQMFKVGINYHLPLAYPDWGIGSIVYFLRIRGNLFFDYTHAKDYDNARKTFTRNYRSYGMELNFDTKWWNQQPISFGIRYSRLADAAVQGISPNQWEIILPVNLIAR